MYNAIRIILMQAGKTIFASNPKGYDVSSDAEYHVLKIHRYDQKYAERAWKIFTSFRSIDQIKQSFFNFKEKMLDDKEISEMMENLLQYQQRSCYLMRYDRIINDQSNLISEIARELGVAADSDAVMEELKALEPPTNEDFDPQTLLFRNHVSKAN